MTARRQAAPPRRPCAPPARMVDFAGWDMPENYGSADRGASRVRRDAGMFDVSHMLALT